MSAWIFIKYNNEIWKFMMKRIREFWESQMNLIFEKKLNSDDAGCNDWTVTENIYALYLNRNDGDGLMRQQRKPLVGKSRWITMNRLILNDLQILYLSTSIVVLSDELEHCMALCCWEVVVGLFYWVAIKYGSHSELGFTSKLLVIFLNWNSKIYI